MTWSGENPTEPDLLAPKQVCKRTKASPRTVPGLPIQLEIVSLPDYADHDFGRAENRFLRGNSGKEESPNTEGRDAA